MGRESRKWITWAFVVVTVLIVAVMMMSTLRRPTRITLSAAGDAAGEVSGETTEGSDGLTLVEVTPKTVQTAIATLNRPDTYSRTVVVEQFWSDDSSSYNGTVAVTNGWTRVDRELPGGQIRHTVTDGNMTYIWYDQETEVYAVAAGDISADDEQTIPTYEDVLEVPVEEIIAAEYSVISGRRCIYVETAVNEGGYTLRYWIDLDNGLLAMAEKLQGEEIVYRMGAVESEVPEDLELLFTLPDGTAVLKSE